MEIKEILKDIISILLIPFYAIILLFVIVFGLFKHQTINQTLSWLLYEPIGTEEKYQLINDS